MAAKLADDNASIIQARISHDIIRKIIGMTVAEFKELRTKCKTDPAIKQSVAKVSLYLHMIKNHIDTLLSNYRTPKRSSSLYQASWCLPVQGMRSLSLPLCDWCVHLYAMNEVCDFTGERHSRSVR